MGSGVFPVKTEGFCGLLGFSQFWMLLLFTLCICFDVCSGFCFLFFPNSSVYSGGVSNKSAFFVLQTFCPVWEQPCPARLFIRESDRIKF